VNKLIVAILIVVFLANGLLVGCGGILTGSGNLKTEDYTFSDFKKVEISSAFEFEISKSSSYSVSVTADDNIIEKVQVTKEGDTLKIGLKPFIRLGSVTLRANVDMPQLHGLDISGASRGTVSEFSSIEDIDITVSGASRVTGDITGGDAEFDISGASTIQLEGSATNIVADVSGASSFDLGGFRVNNANIDISGASTGTVNLSGRLDADVSGASRLSYMGNISTSGASTLSKK